jgi:hypothetical protein
MACRRFLVATVLLAALLAAVPAARAQWFRGLAYEPAVPTGDLRDFSDDSFSWRGMGLDGRRWMRDDISVGVSVSWNVFHSRFDDQVFSQPGQDVYGTQLRDVNIVPIYVNAHYYTGQPHGWRWFLGLNLGTMYADYRLDMGLYNYREENWHLALAPEVGLKFPYTMLLGYVSLRWNNGFAAGDVDEISYFAIRVGVGLR